MLVFRSNLFCPQPKPVLCATSVETRLNRQVVGGEFPSQPLLAAGAGRASMDFSISSKRPTLLGQWIALSLVLCLFWRFAIGEVNVPGQAPVSEYSAKATSLTQLLDWVKWPTPTEGPINVGILGDDPFGGALAKLNPKHAKQIEELKDCQIIFIPKTEGGKVGAILESLGANVLTVGESEGFAKQGGMIGFVMEGDQVRFEINTGAARQAGLKIDLRLLKLAKRVFNS